MLKNQSEKSGSSKSGSSKSGSSIEQVHMFFRGNREAFERIFEPLDISATGYLMLYTIDMLAKGISAPTSAEISRRFGTSRSATSQLLSSLEKKGYIIRSVSDDDKRKMYITLTDKADEQLQNINEYLLKIYNNFKESFGEDNCEKLSVLIMKAQTVLDEILNTDNN